jgi:hypothetical protein
LRSSRSPKISPRLVIIERLGDREKGKPRGLIAYQVDNVKIGKPFSLDPAHALFVLHKKGFYSPPDWRLGLLRPPRLWFDTTMLALWGALEPVLRAA